MSNFQSTSLLNVDFCLKKGLILNWNFTGELFKERFFRHLIVLDTENASLAVSFLKLYYKKMKFGDLIAVINKSNRKRTSLKWKEKSMMADPDFSKTKCCSYDEIEFSELFSQISELLEKSDTQQPLILTVLTQKRDIKKFNQILINIRKDEQSPINFIINVFGQFRNNLNFQNGINFFEFNPWNCQNIMEFYKNYLSKIQFYFVQITLQCESGSICNQMVGQWPNHAFNKVTKRFYGPHMDYQSDTLVFMNCQNIGQLNLVLFITLEYMTLDGQKFKSSKRLSLTALDKTLASRTIDIKGNRHQVELSQSTWFDVNPFKSQNLICFRKNKQINQ